MTTIKNCAFCAKAIKETSDKPIVIHDSCFENYKKITKTKDNYIIMVGKHKGQLYKDVLKNNQEYFEWLEGSKFDEKTAMHYLQYYHNKFKQTKNYFSKEIN
jgi:hypothetical protein